jgi:hypothetical protein
MLRDAIGCIISLALRASIIKGAVNELYAEVEIQEK